MRCGCLVLRGNLVISSRLNSILGRVCEADHWGWLPVITLPISGGGEFSGGGVLPKHYTFCVRVVNCWVLNNH